MLFAHLNLILLAAPRHVVSDHSFGSVISVLDHGVLESVTPGDALDPVDEDDVTLVKHEVVHNSCRIFNFDSRELLRQHPNSVHSDWVSLGDRKTAFKSEQRLGTGDLRDQFNHGQSIGSSNHITLFHVSDGCHSTIHNDS